MLLPCQTRKWFPGTRPWTPFWSKPCIARHRRIDASPLWKKLTPKPKTFKVHVQFSVINMFNPRFYMLWMFVLTCRQHSHYSCNQHARQQIQNQRSQTWGFNVRARPGHWWWNRQVTQVTGQVLATWFAGKSNMLIWIYFFILVFFFPKSMGIFTFASQS